MLTTRTPRTLGTLGALALLTAALAAQRPEHARHWYDHASQVVIPQSRSVAFDPVRTPHPIVIESVTARVTIVDLTARTELDVVVRNPAPRQEEAVLLMPVPKGAVVGAFAFDGQSAEPTAKILDRDEARRIYDGIVRKLKDPALLEFAGSDLLRSSVFPVAAGGTQRIQLSFESLLEKDGARIDYVLPRSESLGQDATWSIDVGVRAPSAISTVFSPSHRIISKRQGPARMAVRLAEASAHDPGSFRLSILLQDSDDVTASLFAYPDPAEGGGWFLLMAGLPPIDASARQGLRREVTIVLDRSGSMAGGKLDQARAAALQVVEGLADGEGFQIIDYASDVAQFAPSAVRKSAETTRETREYLATLRPGGGTNIHDALVEALRPEPLTGTLPIVLFLTDGLPTVGTTSEVLIRELVENGNRHHRRVFTFGVGGDVNAPLLDRIAEVSRATSTYVLPEEDVEVKVARVFKELFGPVLSDVELATLDEHGGIDTRRVRELEPSRLADLFEDDQLVVLGRYRGDAPLSFRLSGDWLGTNRGFAFHFDLSKATTKNAFVPRLWASRRIAELIDDVRQAGANVAAPRTAAQDPFADPRLRELREEIMRLSTRFGILSEYTAFLATEGTELGDWSGMTATCGRELDQRAMRTRWGIGALNQAENITSQKAQVVLNYKNAYLDDRMNRVEVAGVQQICDRAFFQRAGCWIDGRLVPAGDFAPDRVIERGSEAHAELLRDLVGEGRNGVLSLRGDILLRVHGQKVLVTDAP